MQREVPVIVTDPDNKLPATITDARGDTVTVTDVSRIVVLSGGIGETLVALGMRDHIVGRDVSTDFPGIADVALVTNGHDLSAEGTLALAPTLILGDARSGPPEALEALRSSGVPVVIVPEVWTLAESPARITAIAAAVGAPQAGEQLNEYMSRATSQSASSAANRATVAFLYIRGTAAVYLLGGDGSGADDVIEAAGGIDAGTQANLTGFTPLTPEALAAAAPDVILVMDKGLESVGDVAGLVALPGVGQTPAGRNRRVVSIPDGELLNFGPRTPATIATLRNQLS
jgi:iron complex transport system substrate-binding protein